MKPWSLEDCAIQVGELARAENKSLPEYRLDIALIAENLVNFGGTRVIEPGMRDELVSLAEQQIEKWIEEYQHPATHNISQESAEFQILKVIKAFHDEHIAPKKRCSDIFAAVFTVVALAAFVGMTRINELATLLEKPPLRKIQENAAKRDAKEYPAILKRP